MHRKENGHEEEGPALFGIRFSALTEAGLLAWLERGMENREPVYVVTPNLDFARLVSGDEEFRKAVEGAALRLCDSAILYALLKIKGAGVPAKLSGSDLTPVILAHAEQRGLRVFLFGSESATLQAVHRKFPKAIVGWEAPPIHRRLWEDDALNAPYVQQIRDLRPDLVLVALGAPKQELWAQKYHSRIGVPVTLCIGASLDFISKKAVRAPRLLSRLGLEWAWRLAREPRRLGKRYFQDAVFLLTHLARC